jgi:hypothetical protein
MRIESRRPTLTERADLEEATADRAAEVAMHAEAMGHADHAQVFWGLACRCRVSALILRAKSTPPPSPWRG